jgi:hypothetical protein
MASFVRDQKKAGRRNAQQAKIAEREHGDNVNNELLFLSLQFIYEQSCMDVIFPHTCLSFCCIANMHVQSL